jgi:hypothetical protein
VSRLRLAVITDDPPADRGLTAAVERDHRVAAHRVAIGSDLPSDIDGVVVDVPLVKRSEALSLIAGRPDVPILSEMPVAPSVQQGHLLAEKLSGRRIASLNPLAFHVPTKRLLDLIVDGVDPLETFFAVWRFRPADGRDQALAQVVGFAGSLCRSAPIRISALQHPSASVLIALLRYENGVVGSLELGSHLPDAVTRFPELLIECFCHDSAYQCRAENQAITLEADSRSHRDWAPDPAVAMLAAFLDVIQGDQVPPRGPEDDLKTLAVCEEMLVAATSRNVRRSADVVSPPA